MILEFMMSFIVLLQSAPPPADPISSIYNLLEQGGLLMGALLVIYGQHRLYRYMIDKLEEKHKSQVEFLEGELERLSQAFVYKSNQDTDTIRDITRVMRDGSRS